MLSLEIFKSIAAVDCNVNLKFDDAEIEHRRAENLKDQQVRLQNVFGKVKSLVDALSTKTARIDWQMGGQKVCRPFWEYCHSVQ